VEAARQAEQFREQQAGQFREQVQRGKHKSGLVCETAPGKIFAAFDRLESHYHSEWHRYNMKRKASNRPFVTESEFSRVKHLVGQVKQAQQRAGYADEQSVQHNKQLKRDQAIASIRQVQQRLQQELSSVLGSKLFARVGMVASWDAVELEQVLTLTQLQKMCAICGISAANGGALAAQPQTVALRRVSCNRWRQQMVQQLMVWRAAHLNCIVNTMDAVQETFQGSRVPGETKAVASHGQQSKVAHMESSVMALQTEATRRESTTAITAQTKGAIVSWTGTLLFKDCAAPSRMRATGSQIPSLTVGSCGAGSGSSSPSNMSAVSLAALLGNNLRVKGARHIPAVGEGWLVLHLTEMETDAKEAARGGVLSDSAALLRWLRKPKCALAKPEGPRAAAVPLQRMGRAPEIGNAADWLYVVPSEWLTRESTADGAGRQEHLATAVRNATAQLRRQVRMLCGADAWRQDFASRCLDFDSHGPLVGLLPPQQVQCNGHAAGAVLQQQLQSWQA
jgi:hypothetical protein